MGGRVGLRRRCHDVINSSTAKSSSSVMIASIISLSLVDFEFGIRCICFHLHQHL